jgi:hypothetical protein
MNTNDLKLLVNDYKIFQKFSHQIYLSQNNTEIENIEI